MVIQGRQAPLVGRRRKILPTLATSERQTALQDGDPRHDHSPPGRSYCIRAAPLAPPPRSSSRWRRSSPWRHAEGRGAAPPIRKWPPTPVTERRTKCRRARRCARHCQCVRRPGRRRLFANLPGQTPEMHPMTDKAPPKIVKPAAGFMEKFRSKRPPTIAGVETVLTALPILRLGEVRRLLPAAPGRRKLLVAGAVLRDRPDQGREARTCCT